MNGSENTACINKPYDGMESYNADTAAWVAACKKKWKCKEKQFHEIFSGTYGFAEEGIKLLSELIQIPKESLEPDKLDDEQVFTRRFWIIPQAEFEAAPFPRTTAEKLSAYMEETYAEKLTKLGYKKFGGSPLRWHKVFADEGKELSSSIVFTMRYNNINVFFGSQAVCCPLVLSDKYFPMHDEYLYWHEASSEMLSDPSCRPYFQESETVLTFSSSTNPKEWIPIWNTFPTFLKR